MQTLKTKPPVGFGTPESRAMVAAWLANEETGVPVSGNPNVRLLSRDPQRLLYVAILNTQNPKDEKRSNKRTSESS